MHRRSSGDDLQPGTSFEQIVELYEFDRKLKLLVLDAIERVEVAMRLHVGHTLGRRGAFAQTDPNVLSTEFVGVSSPYQPPAHAEWLDSAHAKWFRKVTQEQSRSKEEFINTSPVSTVGHSRCGWSPRSSTSEGRPGCTRGLQRKDRDDIPADFGLTDNSGAGHGAALVSWMKNLNYIRNTCAHHSRLWNRNIDVQLSYRHLLVVPELHHAASPTVTKRAYASLAVLAYLLERISPGSKWAANIVDHIRTGLAAMNRSETEMGCPSGWTTEALWVQQPDPW